MRPHKIINYTSILQVLDQKGCPFCVFLKNYQAALMQEPAQKGVVRLCNFHTWGLAATQNPMIAAQLFLALLSHSSEEGKSAVCDICLLVRIEEEKRVREFVSYLDQRHVLAWLRTQGILCIYHGSKIKNGANPATASLIDIVIHRNHDKLIKELSQLLDQYDPNPVNWGTLGRAAEYLASQRGLHP